MGTTFDECDQLHGIDILWCSGNVCIDNFSILNFNLVQNPNRENWFSIEIKWRRPWKNIRSILSGKIHELPVTWYVLQIELQEIIVSFKKSSWRTKWDWMCFRRMALPWNSGMEHSNIGGNPLWFTQIALLQVFLLAMGIFPYLVSIFFLHFL